MPLDRNASSWTSAQLLSHVRTKAQIPPGAIDYSDAVLLREASAVIWSLAGWALQLAGDGRLSFSFDRSAVASLSSPFRAANEFLLPPHAVGDTIENVVWVDADGLTERPLHLLDIPEQEYAPDSSTNGPTHYAFSSGRVRLYPPTTPEQGALRFNYQRRHGALVADTAANAPTILFSANAGDGYSILTLASTSPFTVGDYVDIVSDQYPYRVIFGDVYVGANSGSSTTVYVPNAYLPTTSELSGMRVLKSGQSPFVSLPLEMQLCVHEKVAANILRLLGDMSQASACEAIAKDELTRVLQIFTPRAKSDRRKIVNANGVMRRGNRNRWQW